jgi:hypothetical protein
MAGAGQGGVDRGSVVGTPLVARIKGSGCGWFRINELGVGGKVNLVMDNFI